MLLEQYKKAKEDEGVQHAEAKGYSSGFIACSVFMVIVIAFCIPTRQVAPMAAAGSLYWAYLTAFFFQKYRFTQKTRYLLVSIYGCIATLTTLILFIMEILK